MEQEQIKYTEDELAKMFFEQILVGMMDGMSNMKNDIVKINSEINKLKLFQEEKDLDEELPNVGITINNKLVEIYQEFKSYGIEMFAGYDEKRGVQIRGIVPAYIIENLINNYAVPLSNEMVEYLTTAKAMKKLKDYFALHIK